MEEARMSPVRSFHFWSNYGTAHWIHKASSWIFGWVPFSTGSPSVHVTWNLFTVHFQCDHLLFVIIIPFLRCVGKTSLYGRHIISHFPHIPNCHICMVKCKRYDGVTLTRIFFCVR